MKADINLLQLLQGIMAIILWIVRIEMETTRDMSASDGKWGHLIEMAKVSTPWMSFLETMPPNGMALEVMYPKTNLFLSLPSLPTSFTLEKLTLSQMTAPLYWSPRDQWVQDKRGNTWRLGRVSVGIRSECFDHPIGCLLISRKISRNWLWPSSFIWSQ